MKKFFVALAAVAAMAVSSANVHAGLISIEEPETGGGSWILTFDFSTTVNVISADLENIHFTYTSTAGANQTQTSVSRLSEPGGGISDSMIVDQVQGSNVIDVKVVEADVGIGLINPETNGFVTMINVPLDNGDTDSLSLKSTTDCEPNDVCNPPVPEPASIALLGCIGGLGLIRHFRRKAK